MNDLIDIETEREIIGILIKDRDSFLDAYEHVRPEDFTDARLATAYKTFIDEYGHCSFIDFRTLAEKSNVEAAYLAECMELGWLSAGMKQKAQKISELAHKRRTYKDCQELMSNLRGLQGEEISARLSEMASNISLRSEKKKILSSNDLLSRVIDLQEERHKEPSNIRGIKTGYPYLDNALRGLRPKRMTVIAAATGFGKTTLALNLFSNTVRAGHRVLFLSNENDVDDNIDRLCGISADMEVKSVENGMNYRRVCNAFKEAYLNTTMFLSDNSPRNIDEVVATISRYSLQHQIELAFVDYIGEISGEALSKENEEMKLARYAQKLVDCAKSMNLHLIVLAQLNRQGNSKGRPTKTELAGCFRIAQKAHSLLIFWQEESKQDVVTVDKNRQGPPNVDIAVSFDRNKQIIKEQGIWLSASKEIVDRYI